MSSTLSTVPGRKKKKDEFTQHFALRLRQLREQRGWTQQGLAERIGVLRAMVANYEGGFHHPPLPTLQKIARVFGVSVDYLLSGSGPSASEFRDRELLEFFAKADKFDFRMRDALKEIILSMMARDQQEGTEHQERRAA